MLINSLNSYDMYSEYAANRIASIDVETAKQQEAGQKTSADITKQLPENTQQPNEVSDNRSRVANLEDISLNFNANAETELIGRDSDLSSLDLTKAISDMKKDQILEQYHYFVGDKTENSFSTDGTVRLKAASM